MWYSEHSIVQNELILTHNSVGRTAAFLGVQAATFIQKEDDGLSDVRRSPQVTTQLQRTRSADLLPAAADSSFYHYSVRLALVSRGCQRCTALHTRQTLHVRPFPCTIKQSYHNHID